MTPTEPIGAPRDEDRLPWLDTVVADEPEGAPVARVMVMVLLGLVVLGAILFGLYKMQGARGVNGEGALIAAQVPLCRNPASRFAFMAQADDAVTLFVDGQSFDCMGDGAVLARALCGRGDLMVDPALAGSDTALTLIAAGVRDVLNRLIKARRSATA